MAARVRGIEGFQPPSRGGAPVGEVRCRQPVKGRRRRNPRATYFGAALRSAVRMARTASRALTCSGLAVLAGRGKAEFGAARGADDEIAAEQQAEIGEDRNDDERRQRDLPCGARPASSPCIVRFQPQTGSTAQQSLILFREKASSVGCDCTSLGLVFIGCTVMMHWASRSTMPMRNFPLAHDRRCRRRIASSSSTSASEWARATIRIDGLMARPCSATRQASKALGMAMTRLRAPAMLARSSTSRETALPLMTSIALRAQFANALVRVLDDEEGRAG